MNRNQNPLRCQHAAASHGVTLLEVIFAIGVVLTGLVGLASLIPVAANNAKTTMELDRSISESTSSAASGRAHAFNDLDSIVIYDKPAAGSTAVAFTVGTSSYYYVPTNSMRTIGWKRDSQNINDPPVNAGVSAPAKLIGKLGTPGYVHMKAGTGLSAGICIDPLGMPEPNFASPFTAVTSSDTAFDSSRFPYYGERYGILTAPNEAIDASGTPPAPSGIRSQWPMSPRMWRATLKSPLYSPTNPNFPLLRRDLIPLVSVHRIFRGSGGLSPFSLRRGNDPTSLLISQSVINGDVVDSARDVSSEYTWFVTLAPPFLGGNTFRQSIVVVRQRQFVTPQYNQDPLALQKTPYTIEEPKDNPAAERVTWVGAAVGFIGGSGGEIRLYGSQSVDDSIQAGQWVMLSRQPHTMALPGPALTPTGPAVHRWYRVLRVEESEKVNGYASVLGTQNIWRRWVSLAGPDWAFQDETTNTTGVDDTFCTIVTGAVSVVESEVVIE